MGDTSIIKTVDLTKSYTTQNIETMALKQINIKVKSGEFIAIMGPSGCGKTTLLNIFGMLDTPSSGQYLYAGKDVSTYSEKERARLRKGTIGFVFQSFNLIDELTVYENIELPLLYLKVSRSAREKKIHSVLEKMNIIHRKKYFPQQLSGGQQQRVALARAIVIAPKVILADEPTGNLDSVNGEEVMKALTLLNEKGTTIIMATHSTRDANYAHRIVNLFDGKIITQ